VHAFIALIVGISLLLVGRQTAADAGSGLGCTIPFFFLKAYFAEAGVRMRKPFRVMAFIALNILFFVIAVVFAAVPFDGRLNQISEAAVHFVCFYFVLLTILSVAAGSVVVWKLRTSVVAPAPAPDAADADADASTAASAVELDVPSYVALAAAVPDSASENARARENDATSSNERALLRSAASQI
jgi:hypothetical protein